MQSQVDFLDQIQIMKNMCAKVTVNLESYKNIDGAFTTPKRDR